MNANEESARLRLASAVRRGTRSDRSIFRQIREHDRVFRDVVASPHQLVAVNFDNELSIHGDLTRQIKLVIRLGELSGQSPEYRWRIPHSPDRPPFAIDVSARPHPLPYRVDLIKDDKDVSHTAIIFDLTNCEKDSTIELAFGYSQANFVDVTKRSLFFTLHTFVWTYTFVSETQYFETRMRFPRGASLRLEGDDTTLRTIERTAEIDGRAVYSYAYWAPPQREMVSGRLTYRIWSPATGPIVAIGAGAIVAIPSAFAANLLTGLLTFILALLVTGGARWLAHRLR